MENIKEIFENMGFIIQEVSFENFTENENLNYLTKIKYPSNDAAKILLYYPDWFIYHNSVDPKMGYIYASVFKNHQEHSDVFQIYKKYFPPNLLIITERNNQYYARRNDSEKEYILLNYLHDIINSN